MAVRPRPAIPAARGLFLFGGLPIAAIYIKQQSIKDILLNKSF